MRTLIVKPKCIADLHEMWDPCTKCAIASRSIHKVLFESIPTTPHNEWDLPVDVLMIGEGPGKGEIAMGVPFVGPAGKLLRETINVAKLNSNFEIGGWWPFIGLANLICCRPCDSSTGPNRTPDEDEVMNCIPHLEQLITLTQPKLVMCLGNIPQQYVPALLGKMRYDCVVHHAKHPSAMLRTLPRGATSILDHPYGHEYIQKFVSAFTVCRTLIETQNHLKGMGTK